MVRSGQTLPEFKMPPLAPLEERHKTYQFTQSIAASNLERGKVKRHMPAPGKRSEKVDMFLGQQRQATVRLVEIQRE